MVTFMKKAHYFSFGGQGWRPLWRNPIILPLEDEEDNLYDDISELVDEVSEDEDEDGDLYEGIPELVEEVSEEDKDGDPYEDIPEMMDVDDLSKPFINAKIKDLLDKWKDAGKHPVSFVSI